MFLSSDDADILVTAFGAGHRTIVAHGGWVGSGELWHPPFELLSRDWRCITYDHRGTGATRSRAPAITFGLLVDDLFRVLDAMKVETCILAGESMGAMVVLEAALREPGRFEGLAIVCGRTSGELTPATKAMLVACQSDFPSAMGAFSKACVPERDCEPAREWGRRITLRSDARAAVELMTCVEGVDFTARFADITLPVLVLQGALDVINPPANAERLAALLPDARLVMHPDAGHVPTLTRPNWVAEQLKTYFP